MTVKELIDKLTPIEGSHTVLVCDSLGNDHDIVEVTDADDEGTVILDLPLPLEDPK